jgi:hypothetical protein
MPTPHTGVPRSRGRVTAECLIAVGLSSVALGANAEVSFTPRVAIYFDNTAQRTSAYDYNTPERQQYLDDLTEQLAGINASASALGIGAASFTADPISTAQRAVQIALPQFGGTLTFGWRDSETTQIALTALYGKTTTTATQINTQYFHYKGFGQTALDIDIGTTAVRADVDRLDLEATWQHRLNETFSLIGGLRAERTGWDQQLSQIYQETFNFVNLYVTQLNDFLVRNGLPAAIPPAYNGDPGAVQWRQRFNIWNYSARFGAAAYVPVGDKHLFYVNGLLHVSHAPAVDFTREFANGFNERAADPQPSETFVGPDISVGYMYRLNDRFGVDLRYRAAVYFPVAGPSDFKDARVNHGIGLGFTTWFGDR